MTGVTSQLANSCAVQCVASGYSGAGGRFPAICGMPVSPIDGAIGSDGRAATGSELDSPSSRVLHELSRLKATGCAPGFKLSQPSCSVLRPWSGALTRSLALKHSTQTPAPLAYRGRGFKETGISITTLLQPMLIDGHWLHDTSATLISVNPATGAVNHEVAAATAAHVHRAVDAASRAASSASWRALLPHQRAAILHRIGDLMHRDAELFAQLQMIENGKVLRPSASHR